ncbi:hypothetical protein SAMN05421837_102846 [Amycolatopsis pretoriensis]|uniref:Uncharacterized protein n=1 Tax=Amycolatopsis pretoriensis TaxID=218821 RepID=A0A1H5QH96_9PSEU|nr:hypothetical protein [Amycolatopsis pretoriensis]SEF24748.1 hypothetical protein SAMN05421837_102846 [Amycolatopsis pretoriensis]
MSDPDILLAKRFVGERPGFDLVGIEHVAVPVTVVGVEVLAQERKALPLLDEFVLRAVKSAVVLPEEIAALLGVDPTLVKTTAADLLRDGSLNYGPGPGSLALTFRGRRTAEEFESIKPVQREIRVTFDRLTWSVADYRPQHLLTKKDARALGMILLSAQRTTRVTTADLSAAALNSLLRISGRNKESFEVLDVLEVSPSTYRYMPARLLVFSDQARGEIQAAITVDGDLSAAHEIALAALGGPKMLNVRTDVPADRPLLPQHLEVRRAPSSGTRVIPPGEAPQQNADVRGIELFEHHQLLLLALETAKDRILIISDSITRSVVDREFLSRLENRLRRRVQVHLMLPKDRITELGESDLLNDLKREQRLFAGRFHLHATGSVLPNTLIFDNNWVASRFPWLSFRGRDSPSYRAYEGSLVTVAADVNKIYDDLLASKDVGM